MAAQTAGVPHQPTIDRRSFLSTQLATPREFRLALGALLASSMMFVVAAPFARVQLGPMPAFVPIYVAALVICDAITAVLLFGQFGFLRSRSLLILASAYVFTAAMTTSYVLMFPGLFAEGGLLGAGPQSTSAMYIFWHGGFPILIAAYALSKNEKAAPAETRRQPPLRADVVILGAIAAVISLVIAYTLLVTVGHGYLPLFIDGNRTSDLGHLVLAGDGVLALVGLAILWQRRPHTVIDLWLMVVMCVWLCDLGLSAILNTGRYDLGWYAGRIYGLLAASSLLVMLLIENGNHYVRLVGMSAKLGEANDALEQLSLQDGLTHVANRRFFDSYLASQVAIAQRHGRTLALVLCDVDSFKAFNDGYGHPAGDECLRQVATALRSCCRRPADMTARYGGEEFAMILPETDLAGAIVIAEAAREAVARLRIQHAHSTSARYVSISGGISFIALGAEMSAEQLILAADQMLFEAKRQGRDRMVSVPPVIQAAVLIAAQAWPPQRAIA